ncbi:sensor histidine kinase [Geodermatophilus marinus]|uniref:sensor histidine kinase n=1 Tax=Geodermatophilus sp. LHW52908 TaxID=2303986 RepID=UPI0011C1AC9A|nr:ATP-binding protein [Geodermatophilus sp. LHW52908]
MPPAPALPPRAPAGTDPPVEPAELALRAEVERLRAENAELRALLRRPGGDQAADPATAARMLAARARTMTSVVDAVTEQSIIGTDPDGVVRVWNPGAERLLGLPRTAVVRRRRVTDFHLAEELDAAGGGLEALVAAARADGRDVRDWTYVTAGGRRRTVSVAVTPRTDEDGAPAGWNFVGTDVTDARETERLKEQFLALVSHELRTPLTSILGYLELVLDAPGDALPEPLRGYLATVGRNAERLQRLVGDLLFTAQVDAGRFPLDRAAVDLAEVVRAAEESLRVSARAAGVAVTVAVPPGGLLVSGDAGRLGQVCDNLLSNAVKYTPRGGLVELSLAGAWRAPDGTVTPDEVPGAVPVARLTVADTGIGIPEDEQGLLFARFARASTARRSGVPGIGLGLAVTAAITAAHGGDLAVASAEGRGTTVTLTLPR